jgi:hypothetical protein
MPNSNSSNTTSPAARTRIKHGTHTRKQRLLIVVLLVCIALIIGCGELEIDASNDHSMQSSIEGIRSTLSIENRAKFDTALIDLNDMLFKRTDAVSQATISAYRPEALVRKILHDKTARDVIDMVEKHRQKLHEKHKS